MNNKKIFLTFILFACANFINCMQADAIIQIINANIKTLEQSTQTLSQLLTQQSAQDKKLTAELEKRRKELAQMQTQLNQTRAQLTAAQDQREKALARISPNTQKGQLLQEFNWRYNMLTRLNRVDRDNESEVNKLVGEMLQFYTGTQLDFFRNFLTSIGKTDLLR